MPTAAASFDDAIDFDEPARKKAPRGPRAAAQKGPPRKKPRKQRRFAFDPHRVARVAAVGMSATLATAIMVNALVMQKGHHPAPLFGKAIALGSPSAPVRQIAPAPRGAPGVDGSSAAAPHPAAQAPSALHADASPPAGGSDAIAQLIEGKVPAPAAVSKPESGTVLGAQRALAKLGFALKPNGTLGPQTRKAIAAFQRTRHLPANGELTRRVVKVLAAESGVRID